MKNIEIEREILEGVFAAKETAHSYWAENTLVSGYRPGFCETFARELDELDRKWHKALADAILENIASENGCTTNEAKQLLFKTRRYSGKFGGGSFECRSFGNEVGVQIYFTPAATGVLTRTAVYFRKDSI